MDGAREYTPSVVVTLPVTMGAQGNDNGSPKVLQWRRSTKTSLVALTILTNYMCMFVG